MESCTEQPPTEIEKALGYMMLEKLKRDAELQRAWRQCNGAITRFTKNMPLENTTNA